MIALATAGLAAGLTLSAGAAFPYAAPVSLPVAIPAGGARLIAASDLNGDGRPDLVLASETQLVVFASQGARDFAASVVPIRAPMGAVGAGDVDGDGRVDLVVGGANALTILPGLGNGAFANTWVNVPLPASGPHALVLDLAVANFDHDVNGKPDIAVVDADPMNDVAPGAAHSRTVAMIYGTPAPPGSFVFDTTRPRVGVAAFPRRVSAADFEGDGRPELVVTSGGDKVTEVWYHNTTYALGAQRSTVQTFALNTHADLIGTAVGNLDGDARPDLAVIFAGSQPNATGGAYRVRPYRNVAAAPASFAYDTQASTMPQEIALDFAPAAVAIRDVTGDGLGDLLFASRSPDKPGLVLLAGTGNYTYAAPAVSAQRFVAQDLVVTDLDHDPQGKADIAVVDATNNAVRVYWHL